MDKFIKGLFDEMNNSNVEYAILRNYDNLPFKPKDTDYFDLDFLVSNKSYAKYISIVKQLASEFGCSIVKKFDRSYVRHLRIIRINKNIVNSVQLDSHIDGQGWFGFYYLTESQILEQRKLYNGFYVVCDFHKALINWLDKLLWGSYVKEKYKKEIIHIFASEKRQLDIFLSGIFPEDITEELTNIIDSGDLEKTIDYRKIFLKYIIRNSMQHYSFETLLWNIRFFYYEAKLRIFPPGLLLLVNRDTEFTRKIFSAMQLIVLGGSVYTAYPNMSKLKWWFTYARDIYPIVRRQGLVFVICSNPEISNVNYKIDLAATNKNEVEVIQLIAQKYAKDTIIGKANILILHL